MNRFDLSRRSFLNTGGLALGSTALATLGAAKPARDTQPKAKRVIFLFQSGGPSQLDLFDHKPQLQRWAGKELPASIRRGQRITTMTSSQGRLEVAPSPFHFEQAGQSGAWFSDRIPNLARLADDICLVRSVHTNAINHDPGMTFLQTGHEFPGRPSLGAWLSWGLGSENRDLPAFTVLISSGGYPRSQPIHSRLWGSGFLPTTHQGVQFRSGNDPVLYLNDPLLKDRTRKRKLIDTINFLNLQRQGATGDPEIRTRMAQYEMAHRMQLSVPSLTDLSDESDATFALYGQGARQPGTYAANCLLARRLAERDVRFIQLFHTGWDHHAEMNRYLPVLARETDQATAGLITDLKQRGLLEDTLVVWAGEFGRTVYSQGRLDDPKRGRDHHPRCFTVCLAGGGIRPGLTYGKTDDFSYNVIDAPVSVHDLQATVLACLGIDHERLTFFYQGRKFRLTDVHGRVVKPLLA